MKVKVNNDRTIVQIVRAGLQENDGYCPCILNSYGNPDLKCICKDMRENKRVGEYCYCLLYQKTEE